MKTDYNRRPEIFSNEDVDFAWVDLTAQTPDLDSARAWLAEHGHAEISLFDDLLYTAPESAVIDPETLHYRGVGLILEVETVGESLSDSLPVATLVESGQASATWRFDISVAKVLGAPEAASA